MGTFFTNIQVRSNDPKAVREALVKIDATPAFLSKAEGGWVSAYPHETESQSEEDMKRICSELSRAINTGVLGVTVHDSDVFHYVLAENGSIVDEYDSCPGYFEGTDEEPSGGVVTKLLPYCVAGTDSIELEKLLRSSGKGLSMTSGIDSKSEMKLLKRTLVKNSPWWAKPFVWGAVSFMQLKSSKNPVSTLTMPEILMEDVLWTGDKLAAELGKMLGIPYEKITSGFEYIEEDEANIDRRSLSVVGDLSKKKEKIPSQKEMAQLALMQEEFGLSLKDRPSLALFFSAFVGLLDATTAPDNLKSICVANGFSVKETKINMLGLGESPIWWNMTLKNDVLDHRKFQFVAILKNNKVHCASGDLEQFDESKDEPTRRASFDYALETAIKSMGQTELLKDGCGHRYAVWGGSKAQIYLYECAGNDLDPRDGIHIWWEPGAENVNQPISGCIHDWLEKRHPEVL